MVKKTFEPVENGIKAYKVVKCIHGYQMSVYLGKRIKYYIGEFVERPKPKNGFQPRDGRPYNGPLVAWNNLEAAKAYLQTMRSCKAQLWECTIIPSKDPYPWSGISSGEFYARRWQKEYDPNEVMCDKIRLEKLIEEVSYMPEGAMEKEKIGGWRKNLPGKPQRTLTVDGYIAKDYGFKGAFFYEVEPHYDAVNKIFHPIMMDNGEPTFYFHLDDTMTEEVFRLKSGDLVEAKITITIKKRK